MFRCEYCNIDLPDAPSRCPLCQNTPTGLPCGGERRFPILPASKKAASRTFLALIAFGTVCAAVICITINLILPAGGWWSMFVVAGIGSLWMDFAVMVKKRRNLPKSILWQVAAVSLIAYMWDRFTGFRGWSVDYVLPILCTCAMIAMTLVAKIRRLHIQDYILYLVIDCILGPISFILILVGAVHVVIPSAVCFGSSLVFLAALLFFEGRSLWTEIQRRLHL